MYVIIRKHFYAPQLLQMVLIFVEKKTLPGLLAYKCLGAGAMLEKDRLRKTTFGLYKHCHIALDVIPGSDICVID